LADPWRGDSSYTLDDFSKIWYEKVIFVVTNEKGPVLSALKLKPEDLNYMDGDAARQIIFGNQFSPQMAAAEREFRLIIHNPDQYYRAKK
jgi:hypothetical protein